MLRVWMMVGMEGLRRRVVALHGSEGTGDELWGQRIQNIGLLQLQSLQLSLDLLKGDAV